MLWRCQEKTNHETHAKILLQRHRIRSRRQHRDGTGKGQEPRCRSSGIHRFTTNPFQDGGEIPPKYTQSSPNPISPSLEWSHVPANTAAFVLIMHDPEAVDNHMTEDHLHWMLLNIPATDS